jgi:hypothetical protein
MVSSSSRVFVACVYAQELLEVVNHSFYMSGYTPMSGFLLDFLSRWVDKGCMSYRTFHLPHCQQYVWQHGVKQCCKLMHGHLGSCMHTDPWAGDPDRVTRHHCSSVKPGEHR